MKLSKRIYALATALAVAALVVVAGTANADDAPDYDYVPGSTYTTAGTITTSGGTRYGSDVIAKGYVYWSIDGAGVYHMYNLDIKDKYEWKNIVADGSWFTKIDWAYGTLKRDGVAFAGLVAHNANGQARLYPVGSPASSNVYYRQLDWAGAATVYHQHVWLTFSWQNTQTRWLRETGKWTIDLPAGEKFIGCATPASEGKNVFTFTTTTSYVK